VSRPMKRMGIFIVLTALFSTPFWWLHKSTGFGTYMALLMWCPGAAGAATLMLTGGSLSELGWRGAQLKWIGMGWLVPLAGLSAAYAAACFLGKASFPNPNFLDRAAAAMGLKGAPPLAGIVNFMILVVGISVGFAWVRMKSHSVWPSTLWHGTHNAFRDMFLNPLTVAASGSGLWLDETGYSLAAMGVCVGIFFAIIHFREMRRDCA
jgi:hypothetical protein